MLSLYAGNMYIVRSEDVLLPSPPLGDFAFNERVILEPLQTTRKVRSEEQRCACMKWHSNRLRGEFLKRRKPLSYGMSNVECRIRSQNGLNRAEHFFQRLRGEPEGRKEK